MRKIITRWSLKALRRQMDQDLKDNINLQARFYSQLRLEKDGEKRKEAHNTLAKLGKKQSLLSDNIDGIDDLLDLGVVEIIEEEGRLKLYLYLSYTDIDII